MRAIQKPIWSRIHWFTQCLTLIAAAGALSFETHPAAAQNTVIVPGDAVVTGFSGTKTEKDVPKTVHPLDRTFIDLDGITVRVVDLSTLGTPPDGQLADVPNKLEIKARDTGQVFGVTLDDAAAPNAFVSASSMYGLQIVSEKGGVIDRLVTGAAGAQWMPGQFGSLGPGGIYRIDGTTGAVTPFATIKTEGRDNTGQGLGNITFDAKSRQLFVSDLETGLIHRLSLDGKDLGTFDHGVGGRTAQGLDAIPFDAAAPNIDITKKEFNSEDPATWHYAEDRRRVFGLATHDGRLYYANAEGPSIWSVAIRDDGSFGDDARIETEIHGASTILDITDLAFDGRGHMILSQRGERLGSYDYSTFAKPQRATVLRYTWDANDSRWTEASEEYALGLKSDYRATQGGLAISYGYDKYGNIDRGQCRQTLWTTGEHLRETGDAKTAAGGPELVSGLQGNFLSRVKPANAPPLEAWFTDNDGRFDDKSAYGHVGDVAIAAPCTPAIERAEAPPPPLYIPPAPLYPDGGFGLTIDKHCDSGAIGGKIRCVITVENTTGHSVLGDARLIDLTRILYGPGAGTIIPVASFSASLPGVICAIAPNFSCVIPAALLLPGQIITIDVFIDTLDLALAGNLGFRNCATLEHNLGYARACAMGGSDIVVEKIGPDECLPGGTCKFGLRIANAGLMPFAGDVLLADAMFVGGAVANAPVTSVNPPIACTVGNVNQLPFTCVTPVSLMPGEERIHWIEVTMPAPGNYWAENCFGALDPALIGALPPGPPFMGGAAGAGNPSCVWVHVPDPRANLKLKKTAQNNGMCAKSGNTLLCDFTIEIRNQDAVPFNGPITVQETTPPGGTIIDVSAPWSCPGVPPLYNCSTGAPVDIPAGGTVAFNVRVAQSVANSEANMCRVPNNAKMSVPPGGAASNIDPTDDEASAEAMTFGVTWVDPITGITFVMCDPTNLKVTKVADGPCVAKGSGFSCGYDVTILNQGPDPYKGPIKLEEKFGVTPVSTSFSGDLNCAGAGANFTCEKPAVELAVGATLKVRVEAEVADDGTCAAPNTATLVSPPENARGNTNGSDDSASATADVPSSKCSKAPPPPETPKPDTPETPEAATCPDGLPIPKNGRCPCPDNATWNRETMTCDGGSELPPTRIPPTVKVCAQGYEGTYPNCRLIERSCPPGTTGRPPNCKFDAPERPLVCGPNAYPIGKRCECKPGYEKRGDLTCLPIVKTPKVCPEGTRGKWPNCKKFTRPCPKGQTGTWPNCKPIVTTPKVCPPGTTGKWPRCKKIPPVVKKCPTGMIGQWPNCKNRQVAPRKCPPGMLGSPPNCFNIPNIKIPNFGGGGNRPRPPSNNGGGEALE